MFIEVRKLDLLEGEEVLELGGKVMQALAQNRKKLKRSLSLRGIFNDHIVAKDMESGKLFRMALTRKDGGIELGEMQEVRQVYVSAKRKAGDDDEAAVEFVCPKCAAKAAKAGECAKCGTALKEKKKKVEKSMDDLTDEAHDQLLLLESIEEISKADAEYADVLDPDLEDSKESIFKGLI